MNKSVMKSSLTGDSIRGSKWKMKSNDYNKDCDDKKHTDHYSKRNGWKSFLG